MKPHLIRIGLIRAFDTLNLEGEIDVRTVVDLAAKKIGALNPDHLLTLDYVDGWEEPSATHPPVGQEGWAIAIASAPLALVMADRSRVVSIPMTWTAKTLTFGVSAITSSPVVILRVSGALERVTDFMVDVASEFFGSTDDA